jgi:hypothetical protein
MLKIKLLKSTRLKFTFKSYNKLSWINSDNLTRQFIL